MTIWPVHHSLLGVIFVNYHPASDSFSSILQRKEYKARFLHMDLSSQDSQGCPGPFPRYYLITEAHGNQNQATAYDFSRLTVFEVLNPAQPTT